MSSKRILVITMAASVSLCASLSMAADAAKPKSKSKSDTANATAKASEPKAADAKASEAKAPRLTLSEPVKDYGTVPKGEKLNWAFEVKNTGDSDLQILAAKPGCGCTVADFDKVIKPGQTGKVTAHVDTTNFSGPIAKAITLETNDPNTPTSQLTIHAIVKPYVEAYPAGFVRFNMLQGDAETQSVTIYSEEEEPFEITKIEVPGEWVKADFHKIEKQEDLAVGVGRPGQTQYKVDITAGGPDAKLGPLADKIRIVTNSKHQPEYFVSLSGVVRPAFRVDPTNINFGEVAPNEPAATRHVTFRSNDLKTPERFNVSKVESSIPAINASLKPGANKGEFELTLQVVKDAKPGDVDGTVTIYTNDKINPKVVLPVKGTIKPAVTTASVSSK
jgi:hypothetical protein